MKGHGEKLSRKQEQAIVALLAEPTIATAAGAIGIGEVTLWRWMQKPGFAEAYRQARRQIVSRAIAKLQSVCTEAVDALQEIMVDKEAKDSARVAAARTILEQAIKGLELEDLATRLESLEAAVRAERER